MGIHICILSLHTQLLDRESEISQVLIFIDPRYFNFNLFYFPQLRTNTRMERRLMDDVSLSILNVDALFRVGFHVDWVNAKLVI